MMIAAHLHRIDPFLVEFMPGIGIRWYGLAYIVGAVIGFLLVRWMAARGRTDMPIGLTSDFALTLLIGAFVGGRLGYCLFYEPTLLGFVPFAPYWGVLALQKGGMASHGGFIGMLIAAAWFSHRHHLSFLHLLDLACFGGPLGIFLGRIANYINGELVGRPAPAGFAHSVKFPQEIFSWRTDQLERLSPVAEGLGISVKDWFRWLEAPERFSLELRTALDGMVEGVQKGNAQVIGAIEPLLTARYPSQLYQAFLEGLFVFILVAIYWTGPRKPGTVAGVFVILYSCARIVGEQFRMPDVEIGFELFGLTRGQELSLLMLVFGVALTSFCWLRPAAPRPGWIGRLPER